VEGKKAILSRSVLNFSLPEAALLPAANQEGHERAREKYAYNQPLIRRWSLAIGRWPTTNDQ
jgi:hypothetical protein